MRHILILLAPLSLIACGGGDGGTDDGNAGAPIEAAEDAATTENAHPVEAGPAPAPAAAPIAAGGGCEAMVGAWVPVRAPNSSPLVISSAGSIYPIRHFRNEFMGRCEDGNRLVKEIGSDLTYLAGEDAIFYAGNRYVRQN